MLSRNQCSRTGCKVLWTGVVKGLGGTGQDWVRLGWAVLAQVLASGWQEGQGSEGAGQAGLCWAGLPLGSGRELPQGCVGREVTGRTVWCGYCWWQMSVTGGSCGPGESCRVAKEGAVVHQGSLVTVQHNRFPVLYRLHDLLVGQSQLWGAVNEVQGPGGLLFFLCICAQTQCKPGEATGIAGSLFCVSFAAEL